MYSLVSCNCLKDRSRRCLPYPVPLLVEYLPLGWRSTARAIAYWRGEQCLTVRPIREPYRTIDHVRITHTTFADRLKKAVAALASSPAWVAPLFAKAISFFSFGVYVMFVSLVKNGCSVPIRLKANVCQLIRFLSPRRLRAESCSSISKPTTLTNVFTVRWVIKPLGNSRRSISKKEVTFSKKMLRQLLLRSVTKFKRVNGINGMGPRCAWEAVRLCPDYDLNAVKSSEPISMNAH